MQIRVTSDAKLYRLVGTRVSVFSEILKSNKFLEMRKYVLEITD